MDAFISDLGRTVFFLLLFTSPLMVTATWLHRRKKAYKEKANEPFTRLLLRPPGESLRLRIEAFHEQFDDALTICALTGIGALATAFATPRTQQTPVTVGLFVITVAVTLWMGRKLSVTLTELWKYQLAFKGERAVAEELNQLMSVGFKVFHDLPFGGYNIDHVIVGTPGVFVVETKTRRKPASIKGRDKATVEAHGDVLEFPNGRDTNAVPQARRNAKSLGKWLSKAIADPITPQAIVTLPGWWVNRRQIHDVNVLNPEEIKDSFPARPKAPLTPQQVQQIVHQITTHCKLER